MPTTTRPFDMAEQLRDEQDIAAYKVGVMRRTDENQVFDVDF